MVDPVATMNVLDGVRALRPRGAVTRFEDLGHYPQIEDPRHAGVALEGQFAPRAPGAVAILTRSPGPR